MYTEAISCRIRKMAVFLKTFCRRCIFLHTSSRAMCTSCVFGVMCGRDRPVSAACPWARDLNHSSNSLTISNFSQTSLALKISFTCFYFPKIHIFLGVRVSNTSAYRPCGFKLASAAASVSFRFTFLNSGENRDRYNDTSFLGQSPWMCLLGVMDFDKTHS